MEWGPYQGVRKLGEGGMGAVWEVVHRETGARYALKTLGGINTDDLQRFQREASTLAGLRHPNVVAVHAGELSGAAPYFVQELCVESLADVLKRGPLSIAATQALAHDLAAGLSYLHAQGVLHRDLKPGNVLLGAGGVAKLGDFGLLRKLGEDSRRLTATGEFIGTPAYMAPEQAVNSKSSGQPADVYALGAVVYACLSGHEPFPSAGGSVLALLAMIQDTPPTPIEELRPDAPPALRELCSACLRKDPAQRPDLAQVLAWLEHGAAPSGRRHAWVLGGFVALTLLSGGALAWVATRAQEAPEPQPASAPAAADSAVTAPRWEQLLAAEGVGRAAAYKELEALLVWGGLSAAEHGQVRAELARMPDRRAGILRGRLAFHDGRWDEASELAERWKDKALWNALDLRQSHEELKATIAVAHGMRARNVLVPRDTAFEQAELCLDRWPGAAPPPAVQRGLHEALVGIARVTVLLADHGAGSTEQQHKDVARAAGLVDRGQRVEGHLRDRSHALRAAAQLVGYIQRAQPLPDRVSSDPPDVAGVPDELAYALRWAWANSPLAPGAAEEVLRARLECCLTIIDSWELLPSYFNRESRVVNVRGRAAHFSLQLAYLELTVHDDPQAAEALLRHAVELTGDSALFVERSLCLVLLGEPAEARDLIESKHLRSGWREFVLAECELLEGNVAEARDRLATLVKHGKRPCPDWFYALAHAQFLLGESAVAVEATRELAAHVPRHPHDEVIPWRSPQVTDRLLRGEEARLPQKR